MESNRMIWLRSLRLLSIFMFFCSQREDQQRRKWDKRVKGADGGKLSSGKVEFRSVCSTGRGKHQQCYLSSEDFFLFLLIWFLTFWPSTCPITSQALPEAPCLHPSACGKLLGGWKRRLLPTALTFYSLKWPALTLCNLSGINCSENVYSLLSLECWRIKGLISFNA